MVLCCIDLASQYLAAAFFDFRFEFSFTKYCYIMFLFKKFKQTSFKQQSNFKNKYSFSEREAKRKLIDERYIGERSRGISYLVLEKSLTSHISSFKQPYKLFAIDNGMKVLDLVTYIRNHLKISQKESIFLIIGKSIANSSHTVGDMYKLYAEPDGFLYVTISQSQVF